MMKNMTLEKLAVMIQKGFEETNAEFMVVKEDMVLIKQRLDSMELELLYIKKQLDNIVYRHEYEMLKDRVSVLEKKLSLRKR